MAMLEISDDVAPKLLSPYLAMQSALASDDLDAAKAQAKAMMEITGHSGSLPEMLHDMLAAETLDALRKPHFETLSNAMITAAKANPASFDSELIIMHCPMVYGDRGADWLQTSEPLQNPYFGAMMLKCGEVKEKIN
jgi:Cu(I)/Ag(I) efflux system membrane fusion protein